MAETKIKTKRVSCLYRVSTLKQLDDFDIPMQRNACQEFISQHPGWRLTKEYTEKGISGYHKSASQRDALLEMQRDVEKKDFDILLVFMFDRLGRREDETSFIVEWLVEQGIEVWSVSEGQQKFDNRVDKLMNYIRFWQSGGESEKTSMRVAEKHKQMVQEGKYRGGSTPLGYTLVKSGEINKKGYETKTMIIDETERPTVKKIFELATEYGYGGRKIANYLNEKQIETKRGNSWTPSAVTELLKNPIYKGVYVSGKRKSTRDGRIRTKPDKWIRSENVLAELIIIDEKTWSKAESIRLSRVNNQGKFPKQTKSPLLFIGFAKCGHCGQRLCSKYNLKKWHRKSDGQEMSYAQPVYMCPQRSAHKQCDGQGTYSQKKIDPLILDGIFNYLDQLEQIDLSEKVCKLRNNVTKAKEIEIAETDEAIEKARKEFDVLNREIIKCLTGESRFSTEQISRLLLQKENEISGLKNRERELQEELSASMKEAGQFDELQRMTPNWKTEFESAPTEVQKMLIAELVNEVLIYKNQIDIHFKSNLFDLP